MVRAEDWRIRLWRRIDQSGGEDACWPWTGATNEDGYGSIGMGDGTTELTHRAVLMFLGRLAPGEWCLHRCDNPPCCNPRHLFVGNNRINVDDMKQKGRSHKPGRPGAAHWRSVLTEADVVAIRAVLDPLPRDRSGVHRRMRLELAERFGVSPQQIWQIGARRMWKHV